MDLVVLEVGVLTAVLLAALAGYPVVLVGTGRTSALEFEGWDGGIGLDQVQRVQTMVGMAVM